MKKYIAASWTSYIGTAFFGAFFLVCLVQFVRGINHNAGIAILVFGAMTALASIGPISRLRNVSAFLEDARSRNELDAVLQDFETAQSLGNDKIRMGSRYIYGKKSSNILEYSQIQRVYQYIHKTNFAEDRRELRAVTTDGKTRTVCGLALKGKDDETMKEIVMRILVKNPLVKIGYRT